MTFEYITYTQNGRCAVLTLNRPDKLNAINGPMIKELHAALDQAEADPFVLVILIKGQGKAFSSGFDLGEVEIAPERDAMRKMLKADFDIIMRFWHSPKPTISIVNGYALGGGFELAMACDITLATPDAIFGEPEPKFGSGIVALLLPWITGPKQAKEMLLFGADRISAARAYDMGLINKVFEKDRIEEEALGLARASALLDQTAARMTKKAINDSYEEMGFSPALEKALETDLDIEVSETPESLEFKTILNAQGVKAAIAWREARWDHPEFKLKKESS